LKTKTRIGYLFLVPALAVALMLPVADQAVAAAFTTLHSFATTSGNGTNSDGAFLFGGLILSGSTLYGTANTGGTGGEGTVFGINTDGTIFTNLHSCPVLASTPAGIATNSDGANPFAGLMLSGGALYGTATVGGTNGNGTVFAINTNGTGFRVIHHFMASGLNNLSGLFTNNDGISPYGGLILSGNTLYGTVANGGTNDSGTVFAVNTNGTGFTILHAFSARAGSNATNSDGKFPNASLVLSGNSLFGTTQTGGTNGNGTVFAVNTSGTGFTTLHTFGPSKTNPNGVFTNADGYLPLSSLTISGNTLFGTTLGGGTNGTGTVFAINTNGTGFTTLYAFSAAIYTNSFGVKTNSDGVNLFSGLLLSGNTLYGTAKLGGTNGVGTVFAVNTNGTGFTTLYTFTADIYTNSSGTKTNSDGADPRGELVLSGNTLYGTTSIGGINGKGTVFGLSFPAPQLTINLYGTNAVLTWPTSVAGFSYSGLALESATNLGNPSVWNSVALLPAVVNGQNTVTNPIISPQQFFQLSQW
jgi:uncharacterized repeat protein (TIGR03803 family)